MSWPLTIAHPSTLSTLETDDFGFAHLCYQLYGWQDPLSGEVYCVSVPTHYVIKDDGPIKRLVGHAEIKLPRIGWQA